MTSICLRNWCYVQRYVQRYSPKSEKKKKDHFQDFGIGLKNNIKMDREGAGRIDLAQNRDSWQAV
jgi:hypothetical protein